jgi:xanthine dehydrogenase YagS FAD-binding subunit
MRRFSHITPTSVAQTITLLDATTRPIAGGTDLIPLMEDRLRLPTTVVSLRTLPDLRGIAATDGGLRIGALSTLADLHRSDLVTAPAYAALAQAAMSAASPQLRNVATIGGNLLQDVRCWYYRGPHDCWLKGGETCPARAGENQYHAIFEQSPCAAVQASDPATALVALDATVTIMGSAGERSLLVAELLAPPQDGRRQLHTLAPDELITALALPARDGWRSTYRKAMERATWAFALAGIAVAALVQNGVVADVRIVLGGVANTPLRATAAEDLLRGQPLSADLAQQAANLAVETATPLAKNGYKVDLVRGMLAEALASLG